VPRKYGPMPKSMQIYIFKKRFGVSDTVDWDAIVDDELTFPENFTNLKENHNEEILNARHEAGYTDDDDAKVFDWDDWESRRDDFLESVEQYEWEIEEEEPDIPEDEIELQEDEDWRVEKTEEGEVHNIEVEIELHRVVSKGKTYDYGRIQLNVSQRWVGLIAKISVNIREELL
jgi:hypothetical protein